MASFSNSRASLIIKTSSSTSSSVSRILRSDSRALSSLFFLTYQRGVSGMKKTWARMRMGTSIWNMTTMRQSDYEVSNCYGFDDCLITHPTRRAWERSWCKQS